MSGRRIVCVELDERVSGHAHIVAVGLGHDPQHVTEQQRVEQVVAALAQGVPYYTQVGSQRARVVQAWCAACDWIGIRTHPDDLLIDNLVDLRWCNWAPAA